MITSLTYRNSTYFHGSIVIGACQYDALHSGYRFHPSIPPCYDEQEGDRIRVKLSAITWARQEIVTLIALAWANQQVAGGWLTVTPFSQSQAVEG